MKHLRIKNDYYQKFPVQVKFNFLIFIFRNATLKPYFGQIWASIRKIMARLGWLCLLSFGNSWELGDQESVMKIILKFLMISQEYIFLIREFYKEIFNEKYPKVGWRGKNAKFQKTANNFRGLICFRNNRRWDTYSDLTSFRGLSDALFGYKYGLSPSVKNTNFEEKIPTDKSARSLRENAWEKAIQKYSNQNINNPHRYI